MPGFDGTGPSGRGPMTGGARGWCNPQSAASQGYAANRPNNAAPVPPTYGTRATASTRGQIFGRGRPRWGLRGLRGRGFRGGRGRGRGRR
jgi:hypothetical protein